VPVSMDAVVTVQCFAVNKNDYLAINEVVGWLKCAADSGSENPRVNSVPPVQPKGGEVYIFKPSSDTHKSELLLLFLPCMLVP